MRPSTKKSSIDYAHTKVHFNLLRCFYFPFTLMGQHMVTALMTQLFQSPRRRCWAGVDFALRMHHEKYIVSPIFTAVLLNLGKYGEVTMGSVQDMQS
ncbi:MAG: hypothetical protein OET79_07145, partial [Nitrospirota bacterium]|nr:hypothetical protein [Nitrospirota bacterium]